MFLPSNITLQFGDTGDFVAELQRRLSLIDLFNEASINGAYDSNTINAVKSFQSMHGIRVDGIAGPDTLRRLNGVITGDTNASSSDDKKEEEQQKTQAAALAVDALYADAAPAPEMISAPAAEERKEIAPEKPAAPPAPNPEATRTTASMGLMDMLAQATPIAPPPPPPSMEKQTVATEQQELAKQKPPEPAKPAEPPKAKEELPVERKPLSAMLQKLVDYIESKLPKSVVDEVKNIGQNMLKAGVKEAPEAGQAPATPAIEAGRGAQQGQQRG